jgi:glycosyltransferase involved in cell wall biosynthesis
MSGERRVWAVIRLYDPNFSGASVQGRRILQQLAGLGYTVRVLAAADLAAAPLAGRQLLKDGLTVDYLPLLRHAGWGALGGMASGPGKLALFLNSLGSDFSFNRSLARLLGKEARPGDIVQFFSSGIFTYRAMQAARQAGARCVLRMTLVSSDDPAANRRGPFAGFKQRAFQQADAIISISSALTESCRAAGLEMRKVHVIPNGIDLQLFRPAPPDEKAALRASLGLPAGRRSIVFVGSAKQRKGIDVLVRAFLLLAPQAPDVDLLIVGPNDFSDRARHDAGLDELVGSLRQEIEAANCQGRVFWSGEVKSTAEYLQAGDLFCFPSRREGLPTAPIEAMGCGLAVVAARLEGVTTDLITHGADGLLIQGYNPHDYAAALLELLEDPARAARLGQNARRSVEQNFNLAITGSHYDRLYRELIEPNIRIERIAS